MIFITLGSQKFQFNRLLMAVDRQAAEGKIGDRIFAQTGGSDYAPRSFEYSRFLDRDEYRRVMESADTVITHGGTGAIIGAVKLGKRVIAVPRLARYGEHVDDHQLQITGHFAELGLICQCLDCDELWRAVEDVKTREFTRYESGTNRMIASIEEFIAGERLEGRRKHGNK